MATVAKFALAVVVILTLTGCISLPVYNPPEGAGAFLQNRLVEVSGSRFFYFFEFAGMDSLEPTGINQAPSSSRVILKTNSPYDATYKISPGTTIVGVRVGYTPHFGSLFTRMGDRYYHIFVRDMGATDEQIAYLSESVPDAEPNDFSGLQGLEFEAQEGHTYQINSRIQDGRASVWIEDLEGTTVSQIVAGFGEANPTIRAASNELMSGDYLPDPRNGWDILDYLPPPPN